MSATIKKLDPKIWLEKLTAYRNNRAEKKQVDAAARNLEKLVKAGQAEIAGAMNGCTVATCGDLTVTLKQGEAAPASITLSTGQTIPWSMVKSLIVGNEQVMADQVATIYGGRSGSISVDCQ